MKLKLDFTEVLYVSKSLDCNDGYLCMFDGNVYFVFKKREITAYVTLGKIQNNTNQMYKIKDLKKIREEFIFDSKYTQGLNNKFPVDFGISKICNFGISKKDIYNLQMLNIKDKEVIIKVSDNGLCLYTFGESEGVKIGLKSTSRKKEKVCVCNLRSFIEIVKSCRENSMHLVESDTCIGIKVTKNIAYFLNNNYKDIHEELCGDIDKLFCNEIQLEKSNCSFIRLQDLFEDERHKDLKYPVIKISKDMRGITVIDGKRIEGDDCVYLNKERLNKYFFLEVSQNSNFTITEKALIIQDENMRIIMLRLNTSKIANT